MLKQFEFSAAAELEAFKVKAANGGGGFTIADGCVRTVGTTASSCQMGQELPPGSLLTSVKAKVQTNGHNCYLGPVLWDSKDSSIFEWVQTYYNRVACYNGSDMVAAVPYSAGSWQTVELRVDYAANVIEYYLEGNKIASTPLVNPITAFGFSFYADVGSSVGYMEMLSVEYTAATVTLAAGAGDGEVRLSWDGRSGVKGYRVKRATTAGGPYTTVAAMVTTDNYVDRTVNNGTTYYYVVSAIDGTGNESVNSNEVSVLPKGVTPVPEGNRLLRVTMIDSSEREYRLPAGDVERFVAWVHEQSAKVSSSYMLHKTGSTEHLLFEKIISFEVMDLK